MRVMGEIWREHLEGLLDVDMGRYGEIWGDMARYGEIWREHLEGLLHVDRLLRRGLEVRDVALGLARVRVRLALTSTLTSASAYYYP